MQHHKYSLTEIENMIPWEREVYLTLLRQHVEEENLNEQVVDPHDLFKTDTDELKLKRSKPLPDFCNTLESCMNLKLV